MTPDEPIRLRRLLGKYWKSCVLYLPLSFQIDGTTPDLSRYANTTTVHGNPASSPITEHYVEAFDNSLKKNNIV